MPDPAPIMWVTGSRSGIGRGLAEHYLERGWRLIGCSRQPATIDHPNYAHFIVDVRDEASVVAFAREAVAQHGSPRVLLNNAGIAAMNPIALTPARSASQILNTNVLGAFVVLREAAKAMLHAQHGRIVNFTSIAVPLNLEGEAIYAASKAAIEALTRIASREFASAGITVNAIGPGPVKTGMLAGVPADALKQLLARQAIPTYSEIGDIANVIDFFIADASARVTGQIIYLGGVHG